MHRCYCIPLWLNSQAWHRRHECGMQAVHCYTFMYMTACFCDLPMYPRRNRVRPFAMRPFCAGQVTGFFAFNTETEDSNTYRQPARATSARRSRACLNLSALCLVLWTSTCMCLTALFNRASTHMLRAFYSADIGISINTTSDSALHALCLRSWPAVRLSASTSQSAADATVDLSAPFEVSTSTLL